MNAVRAAAMAAVVWLSLAHTALAHPLDPALLDIQESADGRVDVLWKPPPSQPGDAPMQVVLPEGCSDTSAPAASRRGTRTTFRWSMRCDAGLAGQRIGVDGLRARATDTLVRIRLVDGRFVQTVLRGNAPVLTVPEETGKLDVLRGYLALGFEHILTGFDHLLFVLGLALLVHGRRQLLWTITAFTAGHSVTLSVAALGFVSLPTGPIEILIALTILVLAVELTRAADGRWGWMQRWPWAVAFAFGLLHGLGFAGALAQVGLPADEIPLALFSFNVGIELGQLLFIGCVLATRAALRRLSIGFPKVVRALPAYSIGSLAVLWMCERIAALF